MIKDLQNGSTYKNLLLFVLPILLENFLQLTYNAVDSVLVGRYAGENALVAVGISNSIMSIVIFGASDIGNLDWGLCLYGIMLRRKTKQ